MQFQFSERMRSLKPSLIREILKADPDPEAISFAAGNPSPDTFPTAEMARIAEEIFAESSGAAFQYGITEGYTPLRAATLERLRRLHATGADFDECIITSGGQQALDLAAKVLLNEGDTLICEDPSFIGALNCFRSQRLKLVGVECDGQGMRIDALERVLAENPGARAIYTIPTFQNPGGSTLSLERRKQMLELAKAHDLYIFEDSPYFELRYSGDYVPTIKSLDIDGRVIFCGSYSKVVAPGLRVGYAIAHREITAKMAVAKQTADVHTNLFFQQVIERLVSGGGFEAHIENCCSTYRHRRDIMLDALERFVPIGKAGWTKPDGGLFLWLTLPTGYDGTELCARAKANKLACVPGIAFNVDESAPSRSLRLNFSLPTDEQLVRGCEILGREIDAYIK